MRQIVLDTETTGLRVQDGNRIIELGCVELVNRELTGNNLHIYFNPDRDSEQGALEVHGLTTEFLSQHNRFEQEAQRIVEYISGAELVIHNAEFDLGFLNAEFKRVKLKEIQSYTSGVVDTLMLAREQYPGKRNNLDALCSRLGISNEHRVLHGALLDAELLADVYIAMTRGQFGLSMEYVEEKEESNTSHIQFQASDIADLQVLRANEQELAAHHAYLQDLEKASGAPSIWVQLSNPTAPAEAN